MVEGDEKLFKLTLTIFLSLAIKLAHFESTISVNVKKLKGEDLFQEERKHLKWRSLDIKHLFPVSGSSLVVTISNLNHGFKDNNIKLFTNHFGSPKHIKFMKEQDFSLSLLAARNIVKAMGGQIGFSSESGKGIQFGFSLPIAKTSN